jgi:hypothetical protein
MWCCKRMEKISGNSEEKKRLLPTVILTLEGHI